MIPFADFPGRYKQNKKSIDGAIKRVLERGWFILGPELENFEKKFSNYLGGLSVTGVNSGTDAIFLALKGLGVGEGDEVITVSNTATPTVTAIRMTGAIPVFIDVEEKSLLMDAGQLEKIITKKTKAIVPVHLFGQPVEMDKIMKVAKRHKLLVVEDVAQAIGAKFKGRLVGTFGDAAAFSFYPTKNLGAFGDAGAVVTKNKKLALKIKQLRNYGEESKYYNTLEGVNSRLDEIQAALLSWGLEKLPEWNKKREEIAELYLKELKDLPLVLPLASDKNHTNVWHLFVIRADKREALADFLKKEGAATAIHYPRLVCHQPAYRQYKKKSLPVSEKAEKEILSLPIYPELELKEVKKICELIKKFYGGK